MELNKKTATNSKIGGIIFVNKLVKLEAKHINVINLKNYTNKVDYEN